MLRPLYPGRCAARGVPQATMVTALTCCYAPGATVGMRSSWHPVIGKRRPSMLVAGALLVDFPSAQFAGRCLVWSPLAEGMALRRGVGMGMCAYRLMAPGCVVPLGITGTTGTAGMARRQRRCQAQAVQADWI